MSRHRVVLAALLAAVLAVPHAFSAGTAEVSDPELTARAKLALMTAEGTPRRLPWIDTHDGVVTLHGTAHSARAARRAEEVVEALPGVVEVRNRMEVEDIDELGPSPGDEALAVRVAGAVAGDPMLRDEDVEVASVRDGVAVLEGTVEGLDEHLRALRVVRGVAGVRRVDSRVKLAHRDAGAGGMELDSRFVSKATQTSKDARLTESVKRELLARGEAPGVRLHVDTQDGVVSLFGDLESSEAALAAERAALSVPGVVSVRNDIDVYEPPPPRERWLDRDGSSPNILPVPETPQD